MDYYEHPMRVVVVEGSLDRFFSGLHDDVVWWLRLFFFAGLALGAWLLFAFLVLGWGATPPAPAFCEKSVTAFPAHPEWGTVTVPCDSPVTG